MKSFKNIICIVLAFTMLFCFVGCNGKDITSNPDATSEISSGEIGFDLDDIGGAGIKENDDGGNSNTTSGGTVSGSNAGGNSNTNSGGTLSGSGSGSGSGSSNKYSGRAKDLGGKTVTVHVWQTYMTGNYPDKPLLAKRAAELNKKIEKQLNCKLEFVVDYSADTPSIVVSVAAGKPKVDIWWINSINRLTSAYSAGQLTPLDNLNVMDFENRDYFTNATDMTYMGGHYYGIGPKTYGIIPVYTNTLLFANVDLLKDCGVTIEELQKLQKSGKWNWSEFRKIAEKVKANNGKNGYNTFAIADSQYMFYQSLMTANGTDWITRNSKGDFSFTGGDKKGQNVLKYYSQLYKDGLMTLEKDTFSQGKTAFLASRMYAPIFDSTWKFEYTFMYPPKGDDASGYKTATDNYSFAVIPKGTKPSGCTDAEIATVLDMLNSPLVSNTEDVSMAATDMAVHMKNALAKETIMGIYEQGEPSIAWGVMTSRIGLNDTTSGWYGRVKKIAEAGGSNMSQIIGEVSSSYNAKLKDIFK